MIHNEKKNQSIETYLEITQMIELLQTFFFWLHSMQDLSSPTRDQTRSPYSGSTES